jgi:hypothetical protein
MKDGTTDLKIGQKIIYKMRTDIRGGLWIKPDENAKIKMSEVSGLHEGEPSTAIQSESVKHLLPLDP